MLKNYAVIAIRKYFEFVRFEHTVFALPFALASMAVAARGTHGWPGWRMFLLILAAMVCARTSAMGFNRIVDRKLDALNPRTAERHLPTGQMSVVSAWWLVIGAAVGLVVVSYFINGICFALSPVALAIVLFYPFTKRLAVRGRFTQLWPPMVLALAVVFWLVGFDIIYATQDYESDKALGLRSLPVRLGIAGSLRFARWAHAVMAVLLLGFGLISQMGWPYYAGWTAIVVCLVHQHRLARNQDPVSVNAAFFRMNAVISVVLLAAVVADVVLR